MTFGSLFAGVGGIDLGLESAGMECRWQVEIDPFCTKVLEKHWPNVRRYGDITRVDAGDLERVDVLAGGFPCQDVSNMGLQKGLAGDRSGLWFEMLRIVRALRPQYVLVENVSGLLVRGLWRVLADLAEIGFDAEWDSICAGHFGAPHERERIFILAYPDKGDGPTRVGTEQIRTRPVFSGCDIPSLPLWLQTADSFAGMDDGLPARFYKPRGGAVGNSVAPFVAEWIGRRIIEAEMRMK
jgi:DNA (cytosine-5)-methyltransferase 1